MASPFRIFRKYQKAMLVVAGVVLMFVFVIGDQLVGYLGGSRRGGDSNRDAAAVAVSWDDGSLTNQELANLVMRRRIVNQFLQSVEYAGLQSSVRAGIEPRELRVQSLLGQPSEQSVVSSKLFADAAGNAGMRVSDEAVVRYLDELGRGHVSRDEMRTMLKQAGGGRVPINFVMDAIREELLAHNYLASHQFAFTTVTPQQRYEDWLRVNDRIVVEAAAIPAHSRMLDVPEPTDAELTAFFDEHKEREPQPDLIGQIEFPSPVPGFRIPRKIDVQFIQANYDQFLAKVENEITEEEIAKYYEENKDPYFIKADIGLFGETPATAPAENEGAPATAAETEKSETGQGASDTEGESTGAPASTPPTGETGGEGETPAADPTNSPTAPATEAAAPESGNQSSRPYGLRGGVFQLAAFAQEETQDAAKSDAQSDVPPATGAASSAPATTAGTSDADPSAAATEASATGESSTGVPAASEKPKEFQPLEEVRDEIRSKLARDRVNEQLTDLMSRLFSQLNAEHSKYYGELIRANSEERDPPAPPAALTNLAPLATEHGLTHGSTGPMSWLQMRETPVGESGDIESGNELFRVLFATEDLENFQPISTEDLDGNRYLAMKTSDTPGRIPTLADVRDEVVRAWKLQKAGDLVLKRAAELAKEAQDANKPLADFFADNKSVEVIRTDPFSRYTGGEVANIGGRRQQQPFRLSEPEGITAAGPELMDKVFLLKDGEVAAVLNHDHSIAYLVRVAEHQSPNEELRANYLTEANNWPGIMLMTNDHARISSSLLAADVLANRGLLWARPADQVEPAEDE